jgi:hypothetical protein
MGNGPGSGDWSNGAYPSVRNALVASIRVPRSGSFIKSTRPAMITSGGDLIWSKVRMTVRRMIGLVSLRIGSSAGTALLAAGPYIPNWFMATVRYGDV